MPDLPTDEHIEAYLERFNDVEPSMPACGLVFHTWRVAMEPLHYRISNPEMAYMNIATTIAVMPACTGTVVDTARVVDIYHDSHRIVLPGLTAMGLLGREAEQFFDALAHTVNMWHPDPRIHAARAHLQCHGWWGMPPYHAQVDRVDRVPAAWPGDLESLRGALKYDPLSVPIAVWADIVGGNGMGWQIPD